MDSPHSESEFYYPEDDSWLPLADMLEQQQEQQQHEQQQDDSQEKIDEFINKQKSVNTVRKTMADMNILRRYMSTINMGEINIENLPTSELNHLLSKFFIEVRRKDGKEYEPGTVSSVQRSIQRYLNDKKSSVNILKDNEFEESRKVLAAKRRSLVNTHGKGNKPHAADALDDKEEDALFDSGEFGLENPVSLQRTIWWFLSLHFGFRARDESRKLRWGDVELQQDPLTGQERLVWLAERGTKTRIGQEHGHQRSFQPKIFATDNNRCPIKFYKAFESHRPAEMKKPDSPFYLAVRHHRKPTDTIWYMKSPLGKNEIGKFMVKAAEKAGLGSSGKKLTNHSVRKTCISRLLDANVPETFVAQLSGHKNINSLQHYKTASTVHQQRMSATLSRMPDEQSLAMVPSSSNISHQNPLSSAMMSTNTYMSTAHTANLFDNSDPVLSQAVFSGANISNCTFQIYNGPLPTVQPAKKRRRIIESDDEEY